MANPERSLMELPEFRKNQQDSARQQIFQGMMCNLRRLQDHPLLLPLAVRYFTSLAIVPDGPKVIYWLAAAQTELVDLAIPFLERAAHSPQEHETVSERIDSLQAARTRDRQPAKEYHLARENVVTVDPLVERKIFNAVRYNDSQAGLVLLSDEQMPGLPGRATIAVVQSGSNWDLRVNLRSVPVDIKAAEVAYREFESTFGRPWENTQRQSPEWHAFCTKLQTATMLNWRLGATGFTDSPGYKDAEYRSVETTANELIQTAVDVFGPNCTLIRVAAPAREHGALAIIRDEATNTSYQLSLHNFGISSRLMSYKDATVDGFSISPASQPQTRISLDFGQFRESLQEKMQFVNKVLSWFYQHSKASPTGNLALQAPELGIDTILQRGVLERQTVSPNTFADIGGNENLKHGLAEYARDFIRVFYGRGDAVKPANILLYGETGIGKTALLNGIASHLQASRIPVYTLRGDLFSQAFHDNKQQSIVELKQMFLYVLINGGALIIQDIDTLLGTRDDPEQRSLVEPVLLRELQNLKEEPSTLVIADTQLYGRIPEAILNAHRIGTHRKVPLITDRQGVEDLLIAVLRRLDRERYQRASSLTSDGIKEGYAIDYSAIAEKIISIGGIIPAQVDRIFRDRIGKGTFDTPTLLKDIDLYIEQKNYMRRRQEEQRLSDVETSVRKTAKGVATLNAQLANLETTLARQKTYLEQQITAAIKEGAALTGEEIAILFSKLKLAFQQLGDLRDKIAQLEATLPHSAEQKEEEEKLPTTENTGEER